MIKSITDFKKPLSNQVINFKQQLQNILANIIIPPQTKFGGYIGITLYVRAIVFGPYLSYGKTLEVLT